MKSNKKEIIILLVLIVLFVFNFSLLIWAISKQFGIFNGNFEKKDIKNNELVKSQKNRVHIKRIKPKNIIDKRLERKEKYKNTRTYNVKNVQHVQQRENNLRKIKQKESENKKYIITDSNMVPLNSDVYDSVEKINSNVLKVKIGYKYGIIDYLGRYLLPVRYSYISYYEEGFYIASLYKDGFLDLLFDKNLKVKLAAREIAVDGSYIFVKAVGEDDFFDVYDKTLRKIATIQSSMRPYVFGDKYFEVRDKNFKNKLVNKNNQLVISPIYNVISCNKDSKGRDIIYAALQSKKGIFTSDNQVIVPVAFNSVEQKTYNGNTIFEGCVENKCAYFYENGEFVKNPENMPFVKKSNVPIQFLTFDEVSGMVNRI